MMKLLSMLYLILFTSSLLFALDIQGEKVVLNSFATFDEAQAKLKELESTIAPDEIELRNKYHFDFVARKSGRAYILVIEPIKTVDEATVILKHFKKTYTDAYTDHYYGPTQGAVVLALVSPEKIEIKPNIVKQKTPIIGKTVSQKTKVSPTIEISKVEQKNQRDSSYEWLWIPVLVLIFIGGLIFAWKGFSPRNKIFDDNDLIRNDEISIQNQEAILQEYDNIPIISPKKEPQKETDIFYRFTKNIFFVAILKELKEACDAQDLQEGVRCMNKIEQYQKNFRRSSVIAAMSLLLKKNEFYKLSTLINKEIT